MQQSWSDNLHGQIMMMTPDMAYFYKSYNLRFVVQPAPVIQEVLDALRKGSDPSTLRLSHSYLMLKRAQPSPYVMVCKKATWWRGFTKAENREAEMMAKKLGFAVPRAGIYGKALLIGIKDQGATHDSMTVVV